MRSDLHQSLEFYLRQLAGRLLLSDWSVELEHGTPDEGCVAQSQTYYGRQAIRIWLDLRGVDRPDEFRATCTHELLHAHFNQVRDVLFAAAGGEVEPSRDTREGLLYAVFKERWELVLDTMARIVAAELPLPPVELRS